MAETENWLEFIRNQELLSIKKYLSNINTKKILEIGGNDGYLAKILTDWGFEVTSIDINPSSKYFDVKKMSATDLEFKSNSFDLVFSSSVIAHIDDKKLLFKEIDRILKEDGLIIHVVPSTWWSLITNFWHYLLLPKIFYKKVRNKSNSNNKLKNSDTNMSNQDKSKLETIKNLLFFHPIGTEKSFIIEIFKFSKRNWKKIFVNNDYLINNELNGPLVYSGYEIFKNHGHKIRKKFACVIPTSYIFVMKKQIK